MQGHCCSRPFLALLTDSTSLRQPAASHSRSEVIASVNYNDLERVLWQHEHHTGLRQPLMTACMRRPAGAGHEEQIRLEVPQSPTASHDADREHSFRARFAALSGRIRRQPPLSPEDSEALLAAFQAPDMTRVQVQLSFKHAEALNEASAG